MSRLGLLVVTLIVGILGIVAWVAWASVERPTCADWDEWWFHHRTTPQHVRYCLHHRSVDINQQDEDGRTLLHRIAADLRYKEESVWARDTTGSRSRRYDGNTQIERLALVKEILRWKDLRALDLDLVDDSGRTAFQYAVRKGETRPMAALLLKAGASFTLSPSTKHRVEEQVIPLMQAFEERFNNPFEEGVDFDRLFACRTTDCLLNEALKD